MLFCVYDRLARAVLPGYPHHITQCSIRRQDVFFKESDYKYCLELLKENCSKEGIEIWTCCLMTYHVHLILIPDINSQIGIAIYPGYSKGVVLLIKHCVPRVSSIFTAYSVTTASILQKGNNIEKTIYW